jgi:subtilisin family serine protease
MPVFVERTSKLKLAATEQILVGFKPKADAADRRRLLAGLGLVDVKASEFDPARRIVAPASVTNAARALDLANRLLEADDLVAFASPNFLAEIAKGRVSDPRYPDQWHLTNTGQHGGLTGEDVRAEGAWALVGGGRRSVVIAILDDGVDIAHPDLAPNIWRNPSRRAPDRHGRDFVDDRSPFDPRPKAFEAPFDDTRTNDIHGTPCAGIAAAAGNNGRGGAGIAWNCRLLAVKMMTGPAIAPADRIGEAIRYAATHADVLSCSWAVARLPEVEDAVAFAVRKGRGGLGAVVFAATGNERARRIGFPASHKDVVAVGASHDGGRRCGYSNYGQGIDVVAPSGDTRRAGIVTTDVSARGRGYASGAYCDDFDGTSAATPLAAGVGALVISANPSQPWTEVTDHLRTTADRIDPANAEYRKGYSLQYGFGRVNAEAAVGSAVARRQRRAKARAGARKKR